MRRLDIRADGIRPIDKNVNLIAEHIGVCSLRKIAIKKQDAIATSGAGVNTPVPLVIFRLCTSPSNLGKPLPIIFRRLYFIANRLPLPLVRAFPCAANSWPKYIVYADSHPRAAVL